MGMELFKVWSGLKRTGLACLVAAMLLSLVPANGYAVPASVSPTAPPDASSGKARVEQRVRQQVAAKGEATFWVMLRSTADLRGAHARQSRKDRGDFVYRQLRKRADESQKGLRSLLQKRRVTYKPFWIVNAIRVTAGMATLDELAAQPEVAEILAARTYELPEPLPGQQEATIQAVEWGISNIRADQVWRDFSARGESIVVANIDTGVKYDHPALVNQYRGRQSDGTFNHNYNWHDPSRICGAPSLAPCDNDGHGTHTMGTIVGDDGSENRIGAAPRATWIAAKGCEYDSCSDAALLSAGQWVLAPTDLNGQNPRADLRPHIVNNSWGTNNGSDPFYRATVQAWVASGIFPVFSNGNAGPGCGTVGSPGSYPESYGVGAYNASNAIASFSSRGAAPSGAGGGTKPDIAAPGVNTRSAWNNGPYHTISGTSMAAPHLAGAIALMWSAAPVLVGDIALTRTILDETATDTSDLTCGGTAADNNVFGQGRLDAYAAVQQSPRGPTGSLGGTVTDARDSAAIAGATVSISGTVDRVTTTDGSGVYNITNLPVGTYVVSVRAFGYVTENLADVEIADTATTTQDIRLTAVPTGTVSGYVRDSASAPIANATVTLANTPIGAATTGTDGFYSFPSVPEGTYIVRAEADACVAAKTEALTVDGVETLDFSLTRTTDSFGYFCRAEPSSFIDASTVLSLTGDDASAAVTLPFPFTFYDRTYTQAYISTNGHLNFLAANSSESNRELPTSLAPNAAIYPFWDDLVVDSSASIRTESLGDAPNRRFVIEWRNLHVFQSTTRRVRFEVILHENGQILAQYGDIANDAREQGGSATIGLENHSGSIARQYAYNQPVITDGLAVRYLETSPPDTAILTQPDGVTRNTSGSFTFSSTEAVSTFQCKLDNEPLSICTSPQEYTALADGDHTFQVRATDASGNTDPTPASYSWTVDTTPPDTTIHTGPNDTTSGRSASFSFSSEPDATFECKLDNTAFSACTSPQEYNDLTEGEHTFQVRGTDTLGNTNTIPASRTWTIDLTSPLPPVIATPASGSRFRSGDLTIAGTAEPGTQVELLDGTVSVGIVTTDPGGQWCLVLTGLRDGAYTYMARATDAARNTSDLSMSLSFTVDSASPETYLEDGPSGAVSSSAASFSFTSEPDARFQCSLDSAEFLTCASPQAYSNLSEGEHTFQVRASDAAGNVDGTPASRTWTVDTVRPAGRVVIQSDASPDGADSTRSRSVVLALSATDPSPASEVVSMRFSNDGLDWLAWEAYATSRPWTLVNGDGRKSVYVQFRDGAGNVSRAAQDTINLDTKAPAGTVTINAGAAYTRSRFVNLTLLASDPAPGTGTAWMRFSNTGTSWSAWQAYAPARTWAPYERKRRKEGVRPVPRRGRQQLGSEQRHNRA